MNIGDFFVRVFETESPYKPTHIKATKAGLRLADAGDVFWSIGPEFEDLDSSGLEVDTEQVNIEVMKAIRSGSFVKAVGSLGIDPRRLCLTQGQIISFARENDFWIKREKRPLLIISESGGTLFLFQIGVFCGDKVTLQRHILDDNIEWDLEGAYLIISRVA